MQPLDVEGGSSSRGGQGIHSERRKFAQKNNFITAATMIALLPAGYHLAIYNSIGIYIWEISAPDLEYFTFRNISDALFTFFVCMAAYIVTF